MSTINPVQTIQIKANKRTASNRSDKNLTQSSSSKQFITSNQDFISKLGFSKHLTFFDAKDIDKPPQALTKLKCLENEAKSKKLKAINEYQVISPEAFISKITSNIKTIIPHWRMKDFVVKPLPYGMPLVCNISIRRNGPLEHFYPRFILYLNSNERQILTAQKEIRLTSNVYKIYTDVHMQSCCIGRVKSNFLGNEYKISQKIGSQSTLTQTDQKKKERQYQTIGYVKYDCKGFNLCKGAKKLKVFLPKISNFMDSRYGRSNITSIRSIMTKTLIRTVNNGSRRNSHRQDDCSLKENSDNDREIVMLVNKEPIWSQKHEAYCMDFNGRVEMVSKRNFLLKMKNQTVLQFGKINDNFFAMDFQYPLSPLQAFSICLSSFAPKVF